MKILIYLTILLLTPFSSTTNAANLNKDEEYYKYLEEYISTIIDSRNENECIENVNNTLENSRKKAQELNRKIENFLKERKKENGKNTILPDFITKWYRAKPPNNSEKNAAKRTIEICKMSTEEINTIAKNYSCGCNGFVKNKKIALRLYYFSYQAKGDKTSLQHIKKLTSPPSTKLQTKEEFEKEMENMKKSIKENEKSLMMHIPTFPALD